jgi:hypothetical protein
MLVAAGRDEVSRPGAGTILFHQQPRYAMSPEDPVQRQLEAYNARDLERFIAEYADDIQVFVPPTIEPRLSGKEAFAEHYRKNRFNLPDLHAELVQRIVSGNTVVDHEKVTGLEGGDMEAVAVYRISDGLIRTVWFY